MIPKRLHFCFGLAPDVGVDDWTLVNYVCVRSAVEQIRPDEVIFYFEREPSGPWWQLTRPLVTQRRVTAPRQIFGNALLHFAHRADVLRLEVLIRDGGIYLDTDVFVHRSFDDLLEHHAVIGQEGLGKVPKVLCNAVILAELGASFLRRWLATYSTFRSKGFDAHWGEHSLEMPMRLAAEHPDEITVLPVDAFHWPGPTHDEVRLLFLPGEREERSVYANHLWARSSQKFTWDMTPGDVRRGRGAFHRWALPYLAGLPDDYGRPSILRRLRRRASHLMRRTRVGRWL